MLNQMLKISQELPEGETLCAPVIDGAFWQDFHYKRIDWHQFSECEPSALSIKNGEPFNRKVAIGNIIDFQEENLPVEVLLDTGELAPTCSLKLTLRDSNSQEVLLEGTVFDYGYDLILSTISSQVEAKRVA